jgi:23S rRNA (guanosine2251-2'-O)-methyltransferase
MATIKDASKIKAGEILYGAHPIIEMLKAKRRKLLSIYTTKPLPKSWDRIAPYLPKYVPNVQYVSREILDRMAGSPDHNGIVAWVSPFKYAEKIFDPKVKKNILLLDSIQDVRNAGAILRSASCIGIDGIVMCKTASAPMTAAVFKASAGLAEYMDVYQAASLKHAVVELKRAGYNFYMAVLNGKDATEAEYKTPLCLVIGNEASGINPEIAKMGNAITLPQRTPEISYNASVAAGILMFLINQKIKS